MVENAIVCLDRALREIDERMLQVRKIRPGQDCVECIFCGWNDEVGGAHDELRCWAIELLHLAGWPPPITPRGWGQA